MRIGEEVAVFETRVTEDAAIAGKPLEAAAEMGSLHDDIFIVAIERTTAPVTPRGQIRSRSGDLVTVYSGHGATPGTDIFGTTRPMMRCSRARLRISVVLPLIRAPKAVFNCCRLAFAPGTRRPNYLREHDQGVDMSSGVLAGVWLGGDASDRSGSPHIAGCFEGEHILVPLLNSEVSAITDQVRVATTLARENGATLSVINPIRVPDQISTEFGPQVASSDDEELFQWALDRAAESAPEVEGRFLYTHRLVRGLLDTVSAHDIDTLVLPRGSAAGGLRRGVTERIAAHAECDTIALNGQAGYDTVPSILLPVAGGPHSGLAADVAQCIAAESDAWIDILHVVEGDASDRERELAEACVEAAYHRIAVPERTSTWVLEADDVTEAIIEQSKYYGLTVLGAPTKGRLRRFVYGSTNQSIRRNANSVVLSARNNTDPHPLDTTRG